MHGIVKKKNLIVLHQRGEAVRKSGTEKNCGKIAENCGKLRKIAENCEKLRNCGKLRKIADLNFSPPLLAALIGLSLLSPVLPLNPCPPYEQGASHHLVPVIAGLACTSLHALPSAWEVVPPEPSDCPYFTALCWAHPPVKSARVNLAVDPRNSMKQPWYIWRKRLRCRGQSWLHWNGRDCRGGPRGG